MIYLGNNLHFLFIGGMINASLKYAATVSMGCHFNTIFTHSIKDELILLTAESVQTLLNHVISVQVLDQSDGVGV